MRKQLRDRDRFLVRLRKLRPELSDASVDGDLFFLQNMQHTGGAEPLRRRPDENECVVGPGLFAACVAKSAVKIDNRFSILPNRNRRAEFTQPLEIFLEKRLEARVEFVWVRLHPRRLNKEGRFPNRPFVYDGGPPLSSRSRGTTACQGRPPRLDFTETAEPLSGRDPFSPTREKTCPF